ncbi:MAG: hypothetical protein V1703_01390 [Candidatus Altiarchaeota archaeon]
MAIEITRRGFLKTTGGVAVAAPAVPLAIGAAGCGDLTGGVVFEGAFEEKTLEVYMPGDKLPVQSVEGQTPEEPKTVEFPSAIITLAKSPLAYLNPESNPSKSLLIVYTGAEDGEKFQNLGEPEQKKCLAEFDRLKAEAKDAAEAGILRVTVSKGSGNHKVDAIQAKEFQQTGGQFTVDVRNIKISK